LGAIGITSRCGISEVLGMLTGASGCAGGVLIGAIPCEGNEGAGPPKDGGGAP